MTSLLNTPTKIALTKTWEPIGQEEPRNVLLASIVVDDYSMHLTALRVHTDNEGTQRAYEYDDDLGRLSAIDYTAFETTEIDGEEYALYATGYGA